MKRIIKKINSLVLATVIFVVSISIGNINALVGSHTHYYIYMPCFEDTTKGHIKTCKVCGETTGAVMSHSTSACSTCGHYKYDASRTDGSYYAQAVNGINDSRMYRYNFVNNNMTEPEYSNPYGMNNYIIGKEHAVFCDFEELEGTGLENDPYIIGDALTLYKILASGGKNYSVPLYFKLGCDIDLGKKQWVDMDERWVSAAYVAYKYLAFNGILDGDGHVITGLYSSGNDVSAGFIPVLGPTGVIKNLHIKDANINTTNTNGAAGVIAGTAVKGSQIIGCSAENSKETDLVGRNAGTVKNSYVIKSSQNSAYYNADGNEVTATQIDLSGNVWYKGTDQLPRLLNRATTQGFADINGDGKAIEYDASDIVALKNYLMWQDGYEDIYGDVDKNGVTDITDLAVLQRQMAGDYNETEDGFWRNIELGKFGIYYTDNDNYDFARKLELYFKNGIGVNVGKQKSAPPSKYAIILKKDQTLTSDYKVTYDNANAVLSFVGKNFTGVEQAVLDFIKNSDYKISKVFTTDNGTLPTEKQSVNVGDNDYFYAWGDEFDEGNVLNGNTTVNYGKWNVRDMGSDSSVGSGNTGQYRNLKFADDIGLTELNEVKDGKLIMHRGIGYGAAHAGEKTGYLTNTSKPTTFDDNDIATSGVLYTKHSMLFKRGYLEMQCTLPSDGYAFPAWWLMTNAGNNNPEVDRSLYSKVFEFNEDYDKSFYYTPDNYKTYKYKLPGATYEIDIFEIIQQPGLDGSIATPSTLEVYQYTLHKWYIHAKTVKGNNRPLKVYELDWANLNKTSGFRQILSATHNGSKYVKNYGSTLICHTGNMEDGGVNANISSNGTKTSKYTRQKLNESYTPFNNQTSAKFGLLWDETQITQYVWIEGDTTPKINKIDIADLNYDNAKYDPEQYAYMLMENHLFTNPPGKETTPETPLTDCTMEIDYVRLYQLDGHRDIVTPETEAFNNPVNRFN